MFMLSAQSSDRQDRIIDHPCLAENGEQGLHKLNVVKVSQDTV